LSRSAINDYGIVILNAMLIATVFSSLAVSAHGISEIIDRTLGQWFGPVGSDPRWWAPVLLALFLFLIDDFVRYGLHYLEHNVAPLWELHKVHHSAEVLNFITAERHHPLSVIYFRAGMAVAIGCANGLFLWLFADKVTPWTILGANGFWIAANMLCSTLRHSPCWLSFGPSIEKWLISPAQHQIHHSTDPRHFGKNLGGTLAIWDRLFRTLHVTGPTREVLAFGLGEETPLYQSFFALYFRPIVAALRASIPSSLSPSR
jgi:sterol desaturase/sphingolipid hydroxylase (fatty acid hydroxylase superfamily)